MLVRKYQVTEVGKSVLVTLTATAVVWGLGLNTVIQSVFSQYQYTGLSGSDLTPSAKLLLECTLFIAYSLVANLA
ncbi:hypothetical protein EDB19DRAFT_1694151 [Suillus lakei]|nr:hypothetical protein EDB19DRAFT_1694151 [Suillus lakei]